MAIPSAAGIAVVVAVVVAMMAVVARACVQ